MIEKLNLFHAQMRRATPVSPARFVVFIVVTRVQVYNRVHETENEAIGSPIDNQVHGHIVSVHRNLVRI